MFPLETTLAQSWPPEQWADVSVIVATSGGPDSVALLRAMATLKTGGKGRLHAAHFNHRLRPAADRDEEFVVELCRKINIPCEVERAASGQLAAKAGDGIEAAARAARYRFFQQAAGRLGARFVAVAHTADDQAETILHRILRGTGIRGLSGMARARPLGHAALIRPLLDVRRAELRAYLDAIGQPYCIDRSNADLRYTRNRLRRRLLPRLQRQYNREVIDALLRLGALAGEAQTVVEQLVERQFERCVALVGPEEATIDLQRLAGQPPYIARELFAALWRRQRWPMQSMGMRQWDELCAMTRSPPSKRLFPGGIAAEVADREMHIAAARSERAV